MPLFTSFGFYAGQEAAGAATVYGAVLIKPTSITSTGGTATLGTDGLISLTSVPSVSINGVFSASYNVYQIAVRIDCSSATDPSFRYRLRASGTDSTATIYVYQYMDVDGTTRGSQRSTSDFGYVNNASQNKGNGAQLFVYDPFLTTSTATRSTSYATYNNGYIDEYAVSHTASTSYDGITFFPGSSSVDGNIAVYGFRK